MSSLSSVRVLLRGGAAMGQLGTSTICWRRPTFKNPMAEILFFFGFWKWGVILER